MKNILFLEKVLSMETNNLFSDWRLLNTTIFNQFNRMDEILNNSKNEIRILCDSVCKLNIGSSKLVAYVFGSRVYGLATVNSDVDLYLDIGIDDIFFLLLIQKPSQ